MPFQLTKISTKLEVAKCKAMQISFNNNYP